MVIAPVCHAYQIWTSLVRTPNYASDRPTWWDGAIGGVTGLNSNNAPLYRAIGSPELQPAGLDGWKKIWDLTPRAARNQVFIPVARNAFKSNYPNSTSNSFGDVFAIYIERAEQLDYDLNMVMLYDNRPAPGAPIHAYTQQEIRDVRSWLDRNGYANVKIIFNARQLTKNYQNILSMPEVDDVMIEGNVNHWRVNDGNRHGLLNYLRKTRGLNRKNVIFQVPVHESLAFKNSRGATLDPYTDVRLFIRSISADVMKNTSFIKSNKCIILPILYGSTFAEWGFGPETTAPTKHTHYGRNQMGLIYSLREHKKYFEARNVPLISESQCASRRRKL